jgi:single-stranded-DNA-specific exonuclease
LKLPEQLCALLARRGYDRVESAKEFLRPGTDHIHPSGGLAGMGAAVTRLAAAMRGGETILVHGDYDVDGICAAALCVRAIRTMGGRAVPFVPHRLDDGYDLTDAGIRAAESSGSRLILTCDCGIVAHDAVLRARRAGIDVIVTDHHTPGSILPDALAVVNPNRVDCGYPDKGLAGAGVAYKVMCALADEVGYPAERLTCFLDLVAIATIADLAPLAGENRALVRWGLRVLKSTPNPGLRALLGTTGLGTGAPISAGQVGFVLAPRINAVGRMSEALRGVRLLLKDSPAEAAAIAESLEEENRVRREVDADTLRQAIEMLERDYDADHDRAVVLASEGWHPGVIGIVASRVAELIHRPTALIALSGAEGKGSARSIAGFHLYDAIHACSEHLLRYGGHRAAAGFSIDADRVDAFRVAFDLRAQAVLDQVDLVPELRIDMDLPLEAANRELCAMLRHMAPFGMGNPTPVLAARGVGIAGPPRIVGHNHLKVTLASGTARLDAIGFGMGDLLGAGLPDRFDVAFKLEENNWKSGSRRRSAGNVATEGIQARLVDIRPAA